VNLDALNNNNDIDQPDDGLGDLKSKGAFAFLHRINKSDKKSSGAKSIKHYVKDRIEGKKTKLELDSPSGTMLLDSHNDKLTRANSNNNCSVHSPDVL